MKIERGVSVKVKQLLPNVTDKSMSEVLRRNRRKGKTGTIDSPVYTNFNHHWLVKHDDSQVVNGISVGYYAIYHEDELEITKATEVVEPRGQVESFTYFDDDTW